MFLEWQWDSRHTSLNRQPAASTSTTHILKIPILKMPILKNIARGTTDPEIDSMTWIKFSNNMAHLALVANLAT